jgi:hypothetical protein
VKRLPDEGLLAAPENHDTPHAAALLAKGIASAMRNQGNTLHAK